MTRPPGVWDDVQTLLQDAIAQHGVVGCTLAISIDGELHEFAAGVADARTREPLRPDALCLVGSTTKVYTATLLMKLVDELGLDLDDPIRKHLPEFRLADEDAASALTMRHLLAHTSGIGIGAYDNCGNDDDAVERYVASLDAQPCVHAPGERWGYSNAGYVIAGRLVEVLSERCWDDALHELLLGPAGLTDSLTRPEQILVRPLARPHLRDANGEFHVAPVWGLSGRSLGPTGSTLAATAGDLARFGRIHLDGGTAADGTRILAADVVSAMKARQTDVPPGWPHGDGWCLGWCAATWDSHQVVGHAGHNLGAGSHLYVLPDDDAAIAMVFNSTPGDAALQQEVVRQLVRELFGITKPDPWLPLLDEVPDLGRYEGRYGNDLMTTVVEVDAGSLLLYRTQRTGGEAEPEPRRLRMLTPTAFGSADGALHAAQAPEGHATPEVFFTDFDDSGRPEFLYESVFPTRREDPDLRENRAQR